MLGLGLPEIIIILIVVVILFFGGRKVTELARGMGRFTGEFKKGKMEIEKELKETEGDAKETAEKPNEETK